MTSFLKRRVIVVPILVLAITHGMYIEYMRRWWNMSSMTFVIDKSITKDLGSKTSFSLGTSELTKAQIYGSSSFARTTFISWEGVTGMNELITHYWKGNLFCETIDKVRSASIDPELPITVNITFGCKKIYEKSIYGTGNFIAMLYGIRLAAHVYGNVGVNFTCYDANETKNSLILPWLTGWFPPRPTNQSSAVPISIQEACSNYSQQPLSYMYNEIQYDLRKMAVGLMGVPRPDHPSALFAERLRLQDFDSINRSLMSISQLPIPQRTENPPFPTSDYKLDDAVLHFRCGDLMYSTHPGFSFMKFNGYTRHISPEAGSIGILTQPFDAGFQSRMADSGKQKRDRCRTVVNSLVGYIKERYPNAQVRIHNGFNENIALTFARMIMANQTISGISSFSVMPAMSTFGKGYIRFPDYLRGPNKWLINPRIDKFTDNIVLFYEPKRKLVSEMKDLWKNEGKQGVLAWFSNDTVA